MDPEPAKAQTRGRRRPKKQDFQGAIEDSTFLETLWSGLSHDRYATDFDSLIAEVERLFRQDEDKPAELFPAYRTGIVTWLADKPPAQPSKLFDSTLRNWLAADQFLWIHDPPTIVDWRVYINAVPQHAAEIARKVSDSITDSNLDVGLKMGSYAITASARDTIVCYIRSPKDRDALTAELIAWLGQHDGFVNQRTVRYTLRLAPGVSYVKSPPLGDVWESLAAEWFRSDDSKDFRLGRFTKNRRFEAEAVNFIAHSDLIIEIIAKAWIDAGTKEQFINNVDTAFISLGLNTATGEIAPKARIIGSLVNRMFPRT
jgi:hypothetical protein